MKVFMQTPIFLLIALGTITLILVIVNFVLFRIISKTNKKIDILLEKGNIKDLKDVLLNQIEKIKTIEEEIAKALERIKNLEKSGQKHFQKIGIVRFNPFSNMGGNQSFVIALLDNQNTGFVISSLFTEEGNRVYAKAIKDGKSDHQLSAEETEALTRATESPESKRKPRVKKS